jgi:energy-coupling factor transport system ATP-binding protein
MLALVGALNPSIVGGRRWFADGVKFGYVFQDTALQFAAATAMSEVLLTQLGRGGSANSVGEAKIAEDIATWVGVGEDADPLDVHPSNQKLLAFAAMSIGADILVVDEPTVGAGGWAIRRLLDRITHLREQGCCVVLISHERRLLPIADRVLEFSAGRLIPTSGSAEPLTSAARKNSGAHQN